MSSEPLVLPLPHLAALEALGRDRARFLHGMCTNEIKKLQPGQGCRAAVVTRQGKMAGVFHALVLEDRILLVTDRANLDALLGALRRFIVADDVDFRVLDVPVHFARGLPGMPALPDAHGVRDGGRTALRDRLMGEDAWLLVGDAPAATGSAEDWDALRIAEGVPRWGVDMGPDLLPMEAGLEPVAISYSKGCYIGQEVIQRVKTYSEPPRMLVALDLDVPLPAGTPLGDGAGTLTSVAGRKGLAVLRKEHQAPGTRLAPGSTVRALPWRVRFAT